MILFAVGHPPKGLRRGAPSACLPQASFNIVPRHFSGLSELRLNCSSVSAERKADSSDRHDSQNEWGPGTPASPPKTNCETTSRPLLNHAVNLSRLSTRTRAERQQIGRARVRLASSEQAFRSGCRFAVSSVPAAFRPKRHWTRQPKQKILPRVERTFDFSISIFDGHKPLKRRVAFIPRGAPAPHRDACDSNPSTSTFPRRSSPS